MMGTVIEHPVADRALTAARRFLTEKYPVT